jgi:hypothetical protein
MQMRRAFACLVFGAICEVALVLSFMGRPSWQPETPWEKALGHLMLPEIAIVTATEFALDHLPGISGDLSQDIALLGLAAGLLFQAAVFGLPLWIVLTIIRTRRKRSTKS